MGKSRALVAAAVLCVALPALGEDLTFRMKSNHRNKVQVEFYSQNRNHAWPGGNKAYNIDDYEVHSFRLTCNRGEKICYGAWVTGNSSRYWGVGINNRQRCSNCCYTCNGGTASIELNP
jgi:hypothetical protein